MFLVWFLEVGFVLGGCLVVWCSCWFFGRGWGVVVAAYVGLLGKKMYSTFLGGKRFWLVRLVSLDVHCCFSFCCGCWCSA